MSNSPSAAYPLIAGDLATYCRKLMEVPDCEYYIHESVITRYLDLPKNPQYGPSEALTALIYCIKKGYGGTQRKRTPTGCAALDLADENNGGRIHYQAFGEKEEFERGTLCTDSRAQHPRWFHFGKRTSRIELKQQIEICHHLIGKKVSSTFCANDISIPSFVMKRRQKMYVYFYERKSHLCAQYINHDIPAIINTFADDVWPQIKLPGEKETLRRRFFDPSDLEMIENELRVILVSSNILGKGSKLDVVLGELVPSSNTRESRIRIVANAQDAPRTTERQRNSITSTPRHNITPSSTVVTPRRLSLSDRSSSSQVGSIPDSLRKES
eukprot:scaffold39992_cov37-Cyclotella_meneghiniana.AAC.1